MIRTGKGDSGRMKVQWNIIKYYHCVNYMIKQQLSNI